MVVILLTVINCTWSCCSYRIVDICTSRTKSVCTVCGAKFANEYLVLGAYDCGKLHLMVFLLYVRNEASTEAPTL